MRKYLERRLEQTSKEGDEGFTLIELLVVLLIIGILLGIAIPTYLSLTGTANKTAAQSNLQTALTGAKSFYVSNPTNPQSYTGIAATSITGTGLTYTVGTASSGPSVVDLNVPSTDSGGMLVLAAQATNGKCFAIADVESNALGTTTYGTSPNQITSSSQGSYYGSFQSSSTTTCTAVNSLATITSWNLSPSSW